MNKTLTSALTVLLCLSAGAVHAQFFKDNAQNLYVPPAKEAPIPTEQMEDWMKYKNPYAAAYQDLSKPHRTAEEVSGWGMAAVAESLSFGETTFEQDVKKIKVFFQKNGWKGYVSHLQEAKLLEIGRSGKYAIHTAASNSPIVLGSGLENGTWQWRMSVPIITTVTQKDSTGEEKSVSTRKEKVEVTLTRVKEGGIDGLAIAAWSRTVIDEE